MSARAGSTSTLLDQRLPPAGNLSDDALRAFDGHQPFARWVVGEAGLQFVLDEKQNWRLGETRLEVSVWLDEDNRYVLRLYEARLKSLCLGELYCASLTGKIQRLNSVSLAQWKRAALIAAGLARPTEVALAELPPDAPVAARETWRIIEQTLRLRRPSESELALSAPTISLWWKCSESTIKKGKAWLKRHGYIRREREEPSAHIKPMIIWRIRLAGEPPFNEESGGMLPVEKVRF